MDKIDSLKKKNRVCGGILGVCALIMLLIIGRMGPEMQPTQIEKILFAVSAIMCFVMTYFVGKFKKAIDALENPKDMDGEIKASNDESYADELGEEDER